jgi:hypothetical protein
VVKTHCALRLGDNLAHLHFLRSLAKAHPDVTFLHAAWPHYLPQLVEVVCDLKNLSLIGLPWHNPERSVDAWKNTGGFWENHDSKNDYAAFMLDWFAVLGSRLGFKSPLQTPKDLLFDYPTLGPVDRGTDFDVLFVNSVPLSGQVDNFDGHALDGLASELQQQGLNVITTRPTRFPISTISNKTVTEIGQLSQACKVVIMVSTGASWATFNIWNQNLKLRVALISRERLTLDPLCRHTATVTEIRAELKLAGIL